MLMVASWLLANLQDAGDGVVLGLRDPETVFHFDCCLPLDIFTPESLVRRKPCGGILVTFRAVCGAVGCHEIQWVVRELFALICAQLLGTLLPCVAERDDVVNLDIGTGVLAADEVDRGARVLVGQCACRDDAVVGTGLERLLSQVAGEDVITCVAAVVVCVGPGGPELIAGVTSLWGSALDRDGLKLDEGLSCLSGSATARRLTSRGTWSGSDALYGMGGCVTASKRANQQQRGDAGQGRGDGANDLNGPSVRRGAIPR